MKTNHRIFDIDESIGRIDAILDNNNMIIQTDGYFDPSTLLDNQTAICKAVCLSVTIHNNRYSIDSDERLSRQFKCILSEFGAVINECKGSFEVCVLRSNILMSLILLKDDETANSIIDTAAKITSLRSIINKKFNALEMPAIDVGVGMDFNIIKITREAFLSEIDSTYLWTGAAVDNAINLSLLARTGFMSNSLMITKSIYDRLEGDYKKFFSFDSVNNCFSSTLVNRQLEEWLKLH